MVLIRRWILLVKRNLLYWRSGRKISRGMHCGVQPRSLLLWYADKGLSSKAQPLGELD